MNALLINDNEFLRQFEVKHNDELASIEYSLQDRKIFLTKLNLLKTPTMNLKVNS